MKGYAYEYVPFLTKKIQNNQAVYFALSPVMRVK